MTTPPTAPDHVSPFSLHRTYHFDPARDGIDPSIWSTHFVFPGSTDADAAGLAERGFPDEHQLYVDPGFCEVGPDGLPLTTPLGLDPFVIDSHGLRIRATRTPASLLAACGGRPFLSGALDSYNGFSQQYGYFEWRGALPNDGLGNPILGCWPAFWHLGKSSNPDLQPGAKHLRVEMDVMEAIGEVGKYHITLHWPADVEGGKPNIWRLGPTCPALSDGSVHAFGTWWTAEFIAFYLDHALIGQLPTPAACVDPWTCIVNLAIGGAWPDGVAAKIDPNAVIDNGVVYPAITEAELRVVELNVYA